MKNYLETFVGYTDGSLGIYEYAALKNCNSLSTVSTPLCFQSHFCNCSTDYRPPQNSWFFIFFLFNSFLFRECRKCSMVTYSWNIWQFVVNCIWYMTQDIFLDVQAKLFVPFQWKNLNDKYVNTRKSLFMKLICHPDSNFVVFNKLPITLLLSCLLSFKWAICIYYFNLEMVTKIYNSSW